MLIRPPTLASGLGKSIDPGSRLFGQEQRKSQQKIVISSNSITIPQFHFFFLRKCIPNLYPRSADSKASINSYHIASSWVELSALIHLYFTSPLLSTHYHRHGLQKSLFRLRHLWPAGRSSPMLWLQGVVLLRP